MSTNNHQERQNGEEKLLEAAEKVFMEKGYAATKTIDIAIEAGVTHAMLHYYFRTKENLFQKVLETKIELLKQFFASMVLTEGLPFEQKIRLIIEGQFDILLANPRLPRFVLGEIFSRPKIKDFIFNKFTLALSDLTIPIQSDLDAEYAKGTIKKITAFDLLIDIISVNIFIFVAYPLSSEIGARVYGSEKEFFEARKHENVELILNRIRK